MTKITSHKTSHPEIGIDLPKRLLLSAIGAGVLLIDSFRPTAAHAHQYSEGTIDQPDTPGHRAFVHRAFEMKRFAVEMGDQAYGALVVRDGQIIGQSWSRVILDRDPTAHAEMSAIRDAAHRGRDRNLNGAILYSSSRPCPMCEAAAYWAGIDQMIYGGDAIKGGAPKLCR